MERCGTPAITLLSEINLLLIWTCCFLIVNYPLISVHSMKICRPLILLVKGHDWLCQWLLRDLKITKKHIFPRQPLFTIFQVWLQANVGFRESFWNLPNILVVCLPCRYLFVCKWFTGRLLKRKEKPNWCVILLL